MYAQLSSGDTGRTVCPFLIYSFNLHMGAVKALTRLRRFAGSSEHQLLPDAISTILSDSGSK